jgi:DDE superfamily endonuclease
MLDAARGHPSDPPPLQVEAGVDGRGAVLRLARRRSGRLPHQVGAYNTQTLIGALDQPRRALGGQKATLLWDGLPAHRSRAMAAWLGRQRSWLVVERLPAYAPDLNPVEMSLPQCESHRASLA